MPLLSAYSLLLEAVPIALFLLSKILSETIFNTLLNYSLALFSTHSHTGVNITALIGTYFYRHGPSWNPGWVPQNSGYNSNSEI